MKKGASSVSENDLKYQGMKRHGNLYDSICSIDNLKLADQLASKGKAKQYGVQIHQKKKDANIETLRKILISGTYKTSAYKTFKVYEPKERQIFALPYYPDRIVHHAIMNVLEPIFVAKFTADTFSCIKGRGIHGAFKAVREDLRDETNTAYCLKLDIRKFYESVNHDVLKKILIAKFKDKNLLALLFEIIDSSPGIPIGNYLSQFFANFYLCWFDHWLKEVKRVKYYYRYADDLVILSGDKQYLHSLLEQIKQYLSDNLLLTVKKNWQVFPVAARGIDFLGYKFYGTHILVRKTIKQSFARAVAKGKGKASIASYTGWTTHANARNLEKKLLHEKV